MRAPTTRQPMKSYNYNCYNEMSDCIGWQMTQNWQSTMTASLL